MFRIMSLNANYYGVALGAWPARRDLIAAALSEAAPDVVALQAVRRAPEVAGGADQARQLADLLPEYRYAAFQPVTEPAGASADGLAFLSRVEIAETTQLPLTLHPALEDTHPRIILRAAFERPAGTLHVFNAHFSWVPTQTRVNLVEALPYLDSVAGDALLVGDLNMPSDSELLGLFEAAGWVDLWDRLHPGQAGYSFYENGRLTKRIDYAWARESLARRVEAIEVISGPRGPAGERMSDHAAILVTLQDEGGNGSGSDPRDPLDGAH